MLGRIWGQTRNSDDRAFDPRDRPKRWSRGPSLRGAQIWGQTRNLGDRTFGPVHLTKRRSGSTARLPRPDMGTDTEFGRPDFCLGGPNQAPVGRSKPAVMPRYGDRHGVTVIRITGLFMTVLWSRCMECLYFF